WCFLCYWYGYNPGYDALPGTSTAPPHVAGLAALVWATGKCATNSCVRSQIESTADQITGTGSYWQWGRVNYYNAVKCSGKERAWGAVNILASHARPSCLQEDGLPPGRTPRAAQTSDAEDHRAPPRTLSAGPPAVSAPRSFPASCGHHPLGAVHRRHGQPGYARALPPLSDATGAG